FIADFSHEVRTPLAGLRSAVESFASGPVDAATEDQLHRIILRQLNRLERLVEGLGELEQIESGAIALAPREVDLKGLAREVADDLHEMAVHAQVDLAVVGDATKAWADPVRLQQVVTNLVENAVKHSGSNRVEIELADATDQVILRVRDYGAGIPHAEHERIFHRFYRIDKSRSQEAPGTGLGLAIAKHLVLLHGGTIVLDSAPRRGATFEVRLPKPTARTASDR
ncbi:MAG TPA: HAMP domain-containing sensor histidine kinase, partial [Thermoanaerobaculia bacterium]